MKPSKVYQISCSGAISKIDSSIRDSSAMASSTTNSSKPESFWFPLLYLEFLSNYWYLHVLQHTSLTRAFLLTLLSHPRYLVIMAQFLYSSEHSLLDLQDLQQALPKFSPLINVFQQLKSTTIFGQPFSYLSGQLFYSSLYAGCSGLSFPGSHELQQMSFKSLIPLVVLNLVVLQSYYEAKVLH